MVDGPSRPGADPGQPIRILHLEDVPEESELTAALLESEGLLCRILRVDSRDGFLSALDQGAFDLILSDFSMPGYDGLQALAAARERRPDVPFVFLSGAIGEDRAIDAVRRGATDYVLKGRQARLAPSLRRALAERAERVARAEAEEALRLSQERYRLLFERNPNPMWVFDVETDRFLDVNEAALNHYGYDRREFLALSSVELSAPPAAEPGPASPPSPAGPMRHRRKDGTTILVETAASDINLEGRPARMVLVRDVTERERSSRILAAQHAVTEALATARTGEQATRRVLESVGERLGFDYAGLWEIDRASQSLRCLQTWATAELDLSGLEALSRERRFAADEGLIGRVWASARPLWVADLRSEPAPPYLTTPVRLGLRGFCGFPIRLAEGVVGILEFMSREPVSESPTLVSMLSAVTGQLGQYLERMRAEEDLVRSREHLHVAQKMEAIGRLAGGVAHDFNNLLNVIVGYSERVQRRLPKGDASQRDLEGVLQAAEKAADLTRQLLTFGRRRVSEPQLVELNALVGEMERMLQRVIGEDVELVTLLGPALARVKIDRSQLEQVFMNLAVNARDAMPRGGKLRIETRNVELDAAYAREHPGVTPGAYVMLAVADTGAGIDAETLPRIFEPFFTTKAPERGTGLGLATVYGIVKQWGGDVWVYSEVGLGTTFRIYLPATEGAAPTASPSADVQGLPRGNETVLVVEDQPALRALLVSGLVELGYHVIEAPNGEQALQLAGSAGAPRPDLLITDVVMPRMSGPELVARLSQQQSLRAIIFISGYSDDAYGLPTPLPPNAGFIEKPFTQAAVARAVRALLDRCPPPGPSASG